MPAGKLLLMPSGLGDVDPGWFIPPHVRDELSRIKYFVVENEKSARRFLKKVFPAIVQSELQIYELNKHHADEDLAAVLKPVVDSHDMALLSEAGCPAVADPGAALVAMAHRLGLRVVPFTGPSSILLALMASGLNGQQFCFHGYLPIEKEQRALAVIRLESESRTRGQTQIFMETPYRNHKMIDTLLHVLHDETLLCIACDLTTPGESVKTQAISKWKNLQPVLGKVPCVFLLLAN